MSSEPDLTEIHKTLKCSFEEAKNVHRNFMYHWKIRMAVKIEDLIEARKLLKKD